MHEPTIETSNIKGLENILSDITRRMYARQLIGKTMIITDNPIAAEAIIYKFWLRIMRQHQKQRSQTQHAVLVNDLTKTITAMQQLQFTSQEPFEVPGADVFIIKPEALDDLLPICHTIFVACHLSDSVFATVTLMLPRYGLAIRYAGS